MPATTHSSTARASRSRCSSAGACITAVDAVVQGVVDNAYALVRPPGHHAIADKGWEAASSATWRSRSGMRRRHTASERIAVVDWDAHHGNGTQEAFYADPSVLTISLHQAQLLSARLGCAHEIGAGAGVGANINLPLPPGSGVGRVRGSLRARGDPALDDHRPELLVVACGFDSSGWDSHARLMLHSAAYRELTRAMLGVADRHAMRTARLLPRGRIRAGLRAVLWPRGARGARGVLDRRRRSLPADLRGIRLPGPAAAPGSGDRGGGACARAMLDAFCETVVPGVEGEPTRSDGRFGGRPRGARANVAGEPTLSSSNCSAPTSLPSGSRIERFG